ncbi:magnesium citrate secondary transporter [Pontibacter toksunensis]|uniref:Magnesium citrate secondary transporter n=1 Tax=Pontibacter toksunensis TaxID=1332631 RepID=A0ABW6BPR5_9BACT
MKSLQHPLFLICLLLFCLNRMLELGQVFLWPLYAYLDDLLCLPLTLSLILAVQRAYFRNQSIAIPVKHIFFAVAAYAVCFELLLPLYKPLYTADVLDVLAYALGAVAFHLFMNKPLEAPAAVGRS